MKNDDSEEEGENLGQRDKKCRLLSKPTDQVKSSKTSWNKAGGKEGHKTRIKVRNEEEGRYMGIDVKTDEQETTKGGTTHPKRFENRGSPKEGSRRKKTKTKWPGIKLEKKRTLTPIGNRGGNRTKKRNNDHKTISVKTQIHMQRAKKNKQKQKGIGRGEIVM